MRFPKTRVTRATRVVRAIDEAIWLAEADIPASVSLTPTADVRTGKHTDDVVEPDGVQSITLAL